MADFLENEVQLLDSDYISQDFIDGVQRGFSEGNSIEEIPSVQKIEPVEARNKIRRIRDARRALLLFFANQIQDNNPDETNWGRKNRLLQLRGIMTELMRGNFDQAEDKLDKLAALPELRFDFANAFNASPVDCILVEYEENPRQGGAPIEIGRTPARFPAYQGPRSSSTLGNRLDAWVQFLSGGAEFKYQINLLKAEIKVGRRKFDEAVKLYNGLFKSGEVLEAIPMGSPRRKFVALHAAFAQLGWADRLFRMHRVVPDSERQTITEQYDQALRVLQDAGVSADNPLHQQVEAYARFQKTKLQNNFNYLGLWDAFVPNQKFQFLREEVEKQIQRTTESIGQFSSYLQQADDVKEQQLDLDLQESVEQLTLDIHSSNRAISTLSSVKITEQLTAIEAQENFLAANGVLGHYRAIIEGVERGGPSPLGVIIAVTGVAGNLINFLDQSQQLNSQRRMAQIDQQIAGIQAEIAQLERRISQLRIEFLRQKLSRLQRRVDMLYELARLYEKRAERQLESAVFLAYLYERALTFYLGTGDLRYIKFDYLDQPLDQPPDERPERVLLMHKAFDAFKGDFERMGGRLTAPNLPQLGYFTESISLRETYPIQFNRFLQEGEMDFVYSMYQLSKKGPATHQCRLRGVGVEVRGLLPPTGFRGSLTHNGQYLVRDKETTMDPEVKRLVPTIEDLNQAVEEQRRRGTASAAVGGVLVYNLAPTPIELSQATPFVPPPPPSEITLDLFEGIGPTGLWHLEIREHGRLAISDILIHFPIVHHKSDTGELQSKVEALIRAYDIELGKNDQLDKISVFSLRQKFPDVFFALQSSQAQLTLTQDDFEGGLTNLQFKSVIVQALDQQGKAVAGVALEISRADRPFKLERVTRADGFSEDLDAAPEMLPPDQRFPVIGTWQIRLQNPAQFAQLGDLRLFFMYAFENA